jgi:ferredoxin
VGRIQGIYANFSPIELRPRNPRACQKCETEDCLNGNERGYPCPTGISLKVVQDSSYCIGCTECIKSCNKHNVALNLRPFASDLHRVTEPRRDEAWLCITLLALTLFHGLTMTTSWESFAPGQTSLLKWMHLTWGTPSWVNFTVGMVVATGSVVLAYWAGCMVSARLTSGSGVSARTLFLGYAFSLLPIALFYHLAHNSMHVLMEGGHIVPLLSDPLGRGTDYLGTASTRVTALVSETPLGVLQVGLIIVGHVFGVVVAHRISRRIYRDERQATKSLLPVTGMMVLLSVAALSLMVLDMNMRAGRM